MRKSDIAIIILIIALVGFMYFVVDFMRSNAEECLRNPVKYFEEKNDVKCMCIGERDMINDIIFTP